MGRVIIVSCVGASLLRTHVLLVLVVVVVGRARTFYLALTALIVVISEPMEKTTSAVTGLAFRASPRHPFRFVGRKKRENVCPIDTSSDAFLMRN